jgi:integrase
MEIDHLPTFLRKFDTNEACISIDTRQAMELLMLTLVRTQELVKAEWAEFNFEKALWIIPAQKTKMKREHIVPLSKQVIKLLLNRKSKHDLLDSYHQSKYVFQSQKGPHKHMCERNVGLALFSMGYRDIHTGHGFRALGMGIAKERLGYRHEVPDRQLAHVPQNEIERSYDRAKYMDERKEMMQRLADYIDSKRPGIKHEISTVPVHYPPSLSPYRTSYQFSL